MGWLKLIEWKQYNNNCKLRQHAHSLSASTTHMCVCARLCEQIHKKIFNESRRCHSYVHSLQWYEFCDDPCENYFVSDQTHAVNAYDTKSAGISSSITYHFCHLGWMNSSSLKCSNGISSRVFPLMNGNIVFVLQLIVCSSCFQFFCQHSTHMVIHMH